MLDACNAVNFFGTVNQIMKRFPTLTPLSFFFIPPSIIRTLPEILRHNREEVKSRISRRGKLRHLDYFEQLCPENSPTPEQGKPFKHLEQVAGQLLLAGFDPIANQFFSTIYFLLQEPTTHALLTKEIRGAFKNYEDITPDALVPLTFLHGCLQESLRLITNGAFGMPRLSPGAMVDGQYIPQGVRLPHLRHSI